MPLPPPCGGCPGLQIQGVFALDGRDVAFRNDPLLASGVVQAILFLGWGFAGGFWSKRKTRMRVMTRFGSITLVLPDGFRRGFASTKLNHV